MKPDLENLKKCINGFRITELKNILNSIGLSTSGKKSDLHLRVIYYLNNNPADNILNLIEEMRKTFVTQDYPTITVTNEEFVKILILQQLSYLDEIQKIAFINAPEERFSNPNVYFNNNQQNAIPMQRPVGQHQQPNNISHMQQNNPLRQPIIPQGPLVRPINKAENIPNNGFVPLPTSGGQVVLPMYAQLSLEDSPFYETISVLQSPKLLLPVDTEFAPNKQRYDQGIGFSLDAEQAENIAYNRRFRDQRIEFGVQVLLRFCKIEPPYKVNGPMPDSLPVNLVLTLNDKSVPLPEKLPTNKPELSGRRPPRPLNLTNQVRISPIIANQIKISWSQDYSSFAYFYFAIYLVRKISPIDLCKRLEKNKIESEEKSKNLIRSKLNFDTDDDDLQMTTFLPASLLCPLGKCRMTVPLRANSCNHVQCFDAHLFLSMNERKPTWKCPFCNGPAPFNELYVDGLFKSILESASTDVEEIKFNDGGKWQAASTDSDEDGVASEDEKQMNEASAKTSNTNPPSVQSSSKSDENAGAGSGSSCVEVFVDLTSDDEDNQRKINSSQNGSNKAANKSSTNSASTSKPREADQSVITLSDDSDSEDNSTAQKKQTHKSSSPASSNQPPPTRGTNYSQSNGTTNGKRTSSGTPYSTSIPKKACMQVGMSGQNISPASPAMPALPLRPALPVNQGIRFNQLPQQAAKAIDPNKYDYQNRVTFNRLDYGSSSQYSGHSSIQLNSLSSASNNLSGAVNQHSNIMNLTPAQPQRITNNYKPVLPRSQQH